MEQGTLEKGWAKVEAPKPDTVTISTIHGAMLDEMTEEILSKAVAMAQDTPMVQQILKAAEGNPALKVAADAAVRHAFTDRAGLTRDNIVENFIEAAYKRYRKDKDEQNGGASE